MDLVQKVMLGAYAIATGVFGALPSKTAPQTPAVIMAPIESPAEPAAALAEPDLHETPKGD